MIDKNTYGERRAVDFAMLTVMGCVSLFALALASIVSILWLRPSADALTVASLVLTTTLAVMTGLYTAMKTKETNGEIRRIAQYVGPRVPRKGQVRNGESEIDG